MSDIHTDDDLKTHAVELLRLRDQEQAALADYEQLVGYYQSGAWQADGIPVEDFASALREFGEKADMVSHMRQISEASFEQALAERSPHALPRSAVLLNARREHQRSRERAPSAFEVWQRQRGVEPAMPADKGERSHRRRDRDR